MSGRLVGEVHDYAADLRAAGVSRNGFTTLAVIAEGCRDNRIGSTARGRVAEALFASERTASRAIRELLDAGLVLLVARGGGRARQGLEATYRLADIGAWLANRDATQVAGQSEVSAGHLDGTSMSHENDFQETNAADPCATQDVSPPVPVEISPFGRDRPSREPAPAAVREGPAAIRRGRSAAARRRASVVELNRQARSGEAALLVEAYAKTCRLRPGPQLLTTLGVQVDELLARSWPAEVLAECIEVWASKGLGPSAFQSVANEVVNRRPDPRGPNPWARTSRAPNSTDANIADILGAAEWPGQRAIGGA